jgi:hypothetical protein
MKITKEEKHLYNFLKIAYTVFSKSNGRTSLFADDGRLFFAAGHYAGIFKYQTELIADGYNFENIFYDIKLNPDGSYYMQRYKTEEPLAEAEKRELVSFLYECERSTNYKLELTKEDGLKISKIVAEAGLWMMDDDIKYLKQFPGVEIHTVGSYLVAKNVDVAEDGRVKVFVNLIFNTEYNPIATSVQKRMDIPVPQEDEEYMDELLTDTVEAEVVEVEEVEEYDPMQA